MTLQTERQRIVTYELRTPDDTMGSELSFEKLKSIQQQALQKSHTERINRKHAVLPNDNARPHTVLKTRQKSTVLVWVVLMYLS